MAAGAGDLDVHTRRPRAGVLTDQKDTLREQFHDLRVRHAVALDEELLDLVGAVDQRDEGARIGRLGLSERAHARAYLATTSYN